MKKLILSLILAGSLNICYGGEVTEVDIDQLKDIIAQDKREKIIMFFATWCTYCKPIVMLKDLPSEKMTFVSVDSDKDAIDKMAKDMSYNLYHVTPSDDMKNLMSLSQSLGVKFATLNEEGEVNISLPYIFRIDSSGKVLEDRIAVEDLQKHLK